MIRRAIPPKTNSQPTSSATPRLATAGSMIANTPNTMNAIAAAMYQPVNLFADWTTCPGVSIAIDHLVTVLLFGTSILRPNHTFWYDPRVDRIETVPRVFLIVGLCFAGSEVACGARRVRASFQTTNPQCPKAGRSRTQTRGHPLAASLSIGQYSTLRLADCRRRSAIRGRSPSRSVVLILWLRHCAPVTHQDQGLAS